MEAERRNQRAAEGTEGPVLQAFPREWLRARFARVHARDVRLDAIDTELATPYGRRVSPRWELLPMVADDSSGDAIAASGKPR